MSKFLIFLLTILLSATMLSPACNSVDEEHYPKANQGEPLEDRESMELSPLFGDSHVVPVQLAKSLSEKINMTVSEVMRVGTINTVRAVDSVFTISDDSGIPVLYIANYADDGFAVISADDRYHPVCALAEQGRYEPGEIPSALMEWFEINFENIVRLRAGMVSSAEFADAAWVKVAKDIGMQEALLINDCCPLCPNYPDCLTHPSVGCGEPDIVCDENSGNEDPCWPYNTTVKGPLLTTKWGQGCTFNDLCPDKDCEDVCPANENALTGCVATAIAQVLRYWGQPVPQQYNFSAMSKLYGNSHVQQLMKDVGVAVDMDYGCEASSAYGHKTPGAFKNTFGYNSANRESYGADGYQIIIQNLNKNQPVVLEGCRNKNAHFFGLWHTYSGCHEWVCDGYERHQNNCYSVLKFHMNWGWNGAFNGWYYHNSWNPATYNYQYVQTYTFDIIP